MTAHFHPADLLAGDVVTWSQCRDASGEVRTQTVEVALLAADKNGNVAYLADSLYTICSHCKIHRVVRDEREIFPTRPVERLEAVQVERDLFRRQRDDYKRRLADVAALLDQGIREARK